MHLKDFFERRKLRRLLNERMPTGKHFRKADKIREFLPLALQWRLDGIDFSVAYQQEQGHYERVQDKVEVSEALYDGGQYSGYGRVMGVQYRMESGASGTLYGDGDGTVPAIPEEGTYYDKWVVDVPESIQIIRPEINAA